LARFFTHAEAGDSVSAAERSIDKQRGIYRKARGPHRVLSSLFAAAFQFLLFSVRSPIVKPH
jgi:hypothetical protein